MLRKEVMEGIEQHIQNLTDFDHIRLLEAEEGHIKLEIEFTEKMLNHYGAVHGGVLYTFCDMASGMTAYSFGVTNVTLSGSINYCRPGRPGKHILSCNTLHKGRTTIVQIVSISTPEGQLLCTAQMTMYVTGPVE